jgi:methanogenic corrinoid protein MtbC1
MTSVVGSGPMPSTRQIGQFRPEQATHRPAAFSPSSPDALATLIEAEIIPRMLLAHRDEERDEDENLPSPLDAARTMSVTILEANAFADLVLEKDAYVLIEHVMRFRERGVSSEIIMLELLAPAARRLGQYWEEDICDFVDVTMGLWRLQEIVHELAARDPGMAPSRSHERRGLFAVMPGDQHSFGIVMVEEFFRRAGWNTWCFPHGAWDDLLGMVRRNNFDLVALSVGNARGFAELPALIEALRRISRNPRMQIIVGGNAIARNPEQAIAAGADEIVTDPRDALARAEILLEVKAFPDTSRG